MPNEAFNIDENIFHQLGLESLPDDRKAAMLDRLAELVEKRVILRLVESLSEEDSAEAEKLSESPDELLPFLASRAGGDIAQIITQEAEALKNELLLDAQPEA
jgi:hypothetical protein